MTLSQPKNHLGGSNRNPLLPEMLLHPFFTTKATTKIVLFYTVTPHIQVLNTSQVDGNNLEMYETPLCESLVWAKSFPVNETATRQRLLSLDGANVAQLPDLPYFDQRGVGGVGMIGLFRDRVATRAGISTFSNGVYLVLFLAVLFLVMTRRRRRAFTPRIMIRCCFNGFNRIRNKPAVASSSTVWWRHQCSGLLHHCWFTVAAVTAAEWIRWCDGCHYEDDGASRIHVAAIECVLV